MTNLKKLTVGLALAATALATSVAQAQGNGNGRRGDRFDRDRGRIDRGVGMIGAERRVMRLTDAILMDLNKLSRIVRNRSMSQGMRGPARRSLENLQFVKQDIRQLRRVTMRRGLVPRLQRIHQRARQDGRMAVQSLNRVRFQSYRAEVRVANTVDSVRASMRRLKRVLDRNVGYGRGGRLLN